MSIEHGTGTYAEVNGVQVYYETHGAGTQVPPLVLLHGGLMSGEMFDPVLPRLTEDRRVILPDLQGHGRTVDPDRPMTMDAMAEDIAGLIRQLELGPVDLVGYSLGGGVAMHLAAAHPELVRRAVITSAGIRRSAQYSELLAQQDQMGATVAPMLAGTPMYELYHRVAPRPEDFGRLLDDLGTLMRPEYDFADLVRGLRMPTLIVAADADLCPPAHFVEIFGLLGGGRRDGGWQGEGRPDGGHALAIVPGRTHYSVATSPLFAETVLAFLD